jgi:hypothetical protein
MRKSFVTCACLAGLVGMFVLAIAWSPASISAAGRLSEKRNFRISKRDARTQPSESGSAFARTARVTVSAPFVPFASITVDRSDDTFAASACTAAANDCSLRGAVAFANANPGTTINVPAGTYNLTIPGGFAEGFNGDDSIGDLDITATNTAIIGAGAASTVIHQTVAGDRVIEVNPFLDPGFVTSISNVTISGGRETTGVGGGGIISGAIGNTLTLTNCIISGNSATGVGTLGGGGVSHAGGNLSISGCSFTGNSTSASGGGLGYSAGDPFGRTPSPGTLTISGSTFTSNTASSSAAGGGAADLFDFNQSTGIYQIDSSSFANNTATNGSGGAIIVESGQLTTTTSSFSGNHAGVSGGAILSSGALASVRYSRLVGNTVTVATNGNTLVRSQGIFAADDDWWGVNTGPGLNDFRSTSGPLFPTTFLKLQATGSPNTICTGSTSSISANIKQRNAGPDLTVELNGLPSFPATIVNATPALGNLSGVSANFVNGSASATFTAGATAGTANIDVTADNQTVTASIIVQTNTTTDPADQSVCQGGTATFSTTASGPGPITFVWKKGATVLNNGDLGGRVTIVSGASTSTLTISNVQSGDADTYTVEATGSCSTATQTATLTVNVSTTATNPTDQTVCQGATASFSTTASGTGPFHYAWTVDGSSFDGDNSSISVPTGSLTVGSHPVSVTVTGACNSVTKNANLTVQAATTTSDPADQTVCQGASAGFSTTAGGTGPFHYAWTVDGSPFNGDNPSISVPTGSLSIGNHTVAVTTTGACGSASQSATLTVQANTTTSDPADQTVCQGATAGFSTTASGTGPFHYAWTLDGSPFNGDSPSISVPTGSLSTGNHTVAVTTSGTCGSASQTATLTVQANTATSDPADETVCQGVAAGFSTTATGTGPFHYSWTVDGSPFNGDNPSISVPTGSLSVGNHTVAVTTTGTCGSAAQSATLTVQANTTTSDPADQTVCQNASASFSTTAGGTGPFHYAWTLDGSPFNGDSPSISVPTGSLSVGNHTVAVTTTGTCGSASQSATLTVQENTTTSDPPDQTVCQGATAAFSTTAGGTGPFHYAWTLDGSPFNGDSASINVPTGSLSIGNHTVAVTTTGACGSASQSATLTVQANTTTSDPPDQTVCQGASAGFSTTAGGTGPFHYSWTVDGSPFNGDSSSISVPTGSLSVGNHTVAVTTTGACGSASQSATLTVEAGTTTSDPADQTVCQGATAAFSTTAGGTGPFHYAWTLDGSPFNGDSASINVPTGSLSVGNHTVAVTTTGTCGTASQSATLTVQATTSTSDPADQQACLGGTASFSTTASGTGPFTFVWKQGATVLTNGSLGGRATITNTSTTSTLTISNVQASDFGTYTVDTSGTCGTASQSATLTVNSSPPTITLNNNVIELWPPDHSYHTINLTDFVTGASSCDGTVNINSVIIDHVTSDEVENGDADGNTYNDIVINCNRKSVQLRAERNGSADGRVYTIYFKATDSLGHSTIVAARVTVPISQNGTAAVDSGPHYAVSDATCP